METLSSNEIIEEARVKQKQEERRRWERRLWKIMERGDDGREVKMR